MTAIRLADTLRACIDSLARTPRIRILEMQLAREQIHSMQRLKDKDAVIAELKVRLAIAETDAQRRERVRQAPPAKPVPDFSGAVPYQDELAKMASEKAIEEKPDGTRSE